MNYKNYSLLFFCASIELGYEPSQKEIETHFSQMWKNLHAQNQFEMDFFCQFFVKTNVFKHTICPAKDLEAALKKFFAPYIENPSNPTSLSYYHNPIEHEQKVRMFLQNPHLAHAYMQTSFLRKKIDSSVQNKARATQQTLEQLRQEEVSLCRQRRLKI